MARYAEMMARQIAAADAYEAMTADRVSFLKALDSEVAAVSPAA